MTLQNKFMKPVIVLKTSDNHRAKKILNFFKMEDSDLNTQIVIQYENLEQVASVCRLMVEANIDIAEVFIVPSD